MKSLGFLLCLLSLALAVLCAPVSLALAQSVGSACTGANRIYTTEGTNNDSLICNGTSLQLQLLQSSKANPARRGIATGTPQTTLDVNGEVRIGNTGIACSASTEGAQRYNSGAKVMQICDGTNWSQIGGSGDLVGWWKLDESSGTTATDSSRKGNNGELRHFPASPWTTGHINGGLTFDGTDDYLYMGAGAGGQLYGSWTLATWVKLNGLPAAGYWGTLFSMNISNSNPIEIVVDNGNWDAGYNFTAGFEDGSTFQAATYATTINTGQWYHVVGTWDLSSKNLKLYVDGSLVASATPSTVPYGAPGAELTIGYNNCCGEGQQLYINGVMDDVRIYDHALTAAQVSAIYNGTM